MKRALSLVVIGLMAASIPAVLAASYESYADNFSSGGYSGNSGTLRWSSGWYDIEKGAYGQDPRGGAVHVDEYHLCASGKCLHMENEGPIPLGLFGAKRYADTSVFSVAELCYDVEAESTGGLTGSFKVQVSTDGGNKWTTIKSYGLPGFVGEPQHHTHDLSEYLVDDLAVRLVANGLVGGNVYLDNVQIKGEMLEEPTTTTTTTQPSTTTTTTPETTTTVKVTTTTNPPATTTTAAPTTTTSPETSTTVERASSTTTTVGDTTTTDREVVLPGPVEPPTGGGGDGLHIAQRGIQAGLRGASFGNVAVVPAFQPLDVSVDFSMMSEVIETSWVWMGLFAIVLTWVVISDIDRRKDNGKGHYLR